jgi:hypothetical protein
MFLHCPTGQPSGRPILQPGSHISSRRRFATHAQPINTARPHRVPPPRLLPPPTPRLSPDTLDQLINTARPHRVPPPRLLPPPTPRLSPDTLDQLINTARPHRVPPPRLLPPPTPRLSPDTLDQLSLSYSRHSPWARGRRCPARRGPWRRARAPAGAWQVSFCRCRSKFQSNWFRDLIKPISIFCFQF